MCLFLFCEPVVHGVEAHSFKGFRGSDQLELFQLHIVQGDGFCLFGNPCFLSNLCQVKPFGQQWIVDFGVELVRSEGSFTSLLPFGVTASELPLLWFFGHGDGVAHCLALRSSCGVAVGGRFS